VNGTSLFKSPNLGDSHRDYRGTHNNWKEQNERMNVNEERKVHVPHTPQINSNSRRDSQLVNELRTDPKSGS